MRTPRFGRITVAVLVVACVGSGCTTMRHVPLVSSPVFSEHDRVAPGDLVELSMRDGTRARVRVATWDGETLVSEDGQRYAKDDISGMKVRRLNKARTIGLTLGIAGVVVVVGLVAMVLAGLDGLGGLGDDARW